MANKKSDRNSKVSDRSEQRREDLQRNLGRILRVTSDKVQFLQCFQIVDTYNEAEFI